jgi:beta-lactamase regulating signal transducer with metallopeptidase domain
MSSFTITPLVQSFCTALLCTLWQGLLVWGFLHITLRALQGITARTRYLLSCSALALISLWFADTWISQYTSLQSVTVYVTNIGHAPQAVVAHQVGSTAKATPATPFTSMLPYIASYAPVIVLLYITGLAVMLLRFALHYYQLRTMRYVGVATPPPHISHMLAQAQDAMGIYRKVTLLLSSRVNVPVVMGAIRPVILLPVATISQLTPQQLEAIVLHELAHIRRHDYLINVVQTLLETALFFNPFVWLISRAIRRERELCCDDLVVSCAAEPIHYARALANLAQLATASGNTLSLAASGQKNELLTRIKRIMEMNNTRPSSGRYPALAIATAALLLVASVATFTPTFAQKSDKEKAPASTTQKTTSKKVTVDDSGRKKVVTKTVTHSSAGDEGDTNPGNVTVRVYGTDDNDNGHHHHHSHTSGITIDDVGDHCEGKKKCKKVVISASDHRTGKNLSMSLTDLGKEMENVHIELDNIDFDQIQADLKSAMEELKNELHLENLGEDIKIEINKSITEARKAQAKRDMAMAKRDMKMAKRDMAIAERDRIQAERDHETAEADAITAEHDRARAIADSKKNHADTDDIETMLAKMEKDGLLARNQKFRIEKEGNNLTINGKPQPASVLQKYAPWLRGDEITIKGSKGNLSVSISN